MHLDAITRQQRGDFVATCNSEALQLFCKGTAATGRPALDINIQTKIFISKRPYSTRPRAPRRLRGRPRARRDAITRQRCVDFVATFHLSSFATYCKGTAANGRPALNIGIHTKLLISKRPYSTRPRAPWRLRGRPRARHDVVARQRRGDFVATCNSEALHLFCKGTAANGRPALDIGIHTKLFISKRPYSMRPRAPWRLRGRPRARRDVVARRRRDDFVATCNSEALQPFCKGTAANGRPALNIGIHTKLFISKRPYSMRPRAPRRLRGRPRARRYVIMRQRRGDFVATFDLSCFATFCKGTSATGRPALDIGIQTK